VQLKAGNGSHLPVQISIRPVAGSDSRCATIGMVVTDMTEARRTEGLLRAFTHRVVQVQEAERGRLAYELHDHITQLLCAVLVRSQTLADQLSPRDRTSKKEAIKLRELLGETAEEVERIARNLRPGVLEQLGLAAVLQTTSTEFSERTGVIVHLTSAELTARLPADTELALYRILQEALKNVELHARARHVTVRLLQSEGLVQLAIKDDGIGFNPGRRANRRQKPGGLGLLGMRERAAYVGGELTIKSVLRVGTEIAVRIIQPATNPTPPDIDL
jgi:signal transduction histidine kinase